MQRLSTAQSQSRTAGRERVVGLVRATGAGTLIAGLAFGLGRLTRRREFAERERRMLREAEERLHALVEHSSDLIVVIAQDGTVAYEAGSVEAVLGVQRGHLRGRRLADWVEPTDHDRLLALCQTQSQEQDEVRLLRGDGELRSCVVRATSLRSHPGWRAVVLHIWDVSDRKELERELRIAQKLEAVGQLSAGIAHEINTPIQFVSDTNRFLDNAFADLQVVLDAYAELLAAAQDEAVTTELIRRVEEAEEIADISYLRARIPDAFVRSFDGIQRVAKIVSAMRAFAHPPVPERSLVDINDAVRNTLIVATNEYRYVADVVTELGEVPLVECNGSDLNQVLLNLIINAADAIVDVVGDSGERGQITVRTWSQEESVLISVADSGVGIPDEIADRVFDPFFTTKELGRGTGQGLTVSRSLVVERHNGSLTFETSPREGTTFLVRLPIRSSSAPRHVAAAA
jgi:PAS domain S-box-containing protein